MSRTWRVASIPGDGIGQEVLPVAMAVVDAALYVDGDSIEWETFDWGCTPCKTTGRLMPVDELDTLVGFDAIFLGAVGDPEVPDDVSLWQLLIPIRRHFDHFVNLRPVRDFDGVPARVRLSYGAGVDLVVVRENTEGEYSEIGGRDFQGTSRELAIQTDMFTRVGIERIGRYAFELARSRRGRLTSATKSNGIIHTMPFWDEVIADTAVEFPDVAVSKGLIDALAAELVLKPETFDVIVASNLFGDVLSDLAAAVVGGLGLAASANLSADPNKPSLFEPVHGSAPDIAGQGIANLVAAVWSGALMLEHLGAHAAAARIMVAIEQSLRHPATRTSDLGGTASTEKQAGRPSSTSSPISLQRWRRRLRKDEAMNGREQVRAVHVAKLAAKDSTGQLLGALGIDVHDARALATPKRHRLGCCYATRSRLVTDGNRFSVSTDDDTGSTDGEIGFFQEDTWCFRGAGRCTGEGISCGEGPTGSLGNIPPATRPRLAEAQRRGGHLHTQVIRLPLPSTPDF